MAWGNEGPGYMPRNGVVLSDQEIWNDMQDAKRRRAAYIAENTVTQDSLLSDWAKAAGQNMANRWYDASHYEKYLPDQALTGMKDMLGGSQWYTDPSTGRDTRTTNPWTKLTADMQANGSYTGPSLQNIYRAGLSKEDYNASFSDPWGEQSYSEFQQSLNPWEDQWNLQNPGYTDSQIGDFWSQRQQARDRVNSGYQAMQGGSAMGGMLPNTNVGGLGGLGGMRPQEGGGATPFGALAPQPNTTTWAPDPTSPWGNTWRP